MDAMQEIKTQISATLANELMKKMTSEHLQHIIKTTLEAKKSYYDPTFFDGIIQDMIRSVVREEIKARIEDNKDAIKLQIKETLSDAMIEKVIEQMKCDFSSGIEMKFQFREKL